MGDTFRVNPLLWLAVPLVITAVAAIVMFWRDRAAPPDRDEQVRRIAEAMKRHDQ